MTIDRAVVLCEDRAHAQFAKQWLQQRAVQLVKEPLAAPSAKGAASQFVLRQFEEIAINSRRKRNQRGLGFIVIIDGDELGLQSRQSQLLDVARRALSDPTLQWRDLSSVALLCPTWSIETWIRRLQGDMGVVETTQTKRIKSRSLNEDELHAVEGFDDCRRSIRCSANLPALQASVSETAKLGL